MVEICSGWAMPARRQCVANEPAATEVFGRFAEPRSRQPWGSANRLEQYVDLVRELSRLRRAGARHSLGALLSQRFVASRHFAIRARTAPL
jgi:hypothetical protein